MLEAKPRAIGHLHVKIGMLIGFVTSRVDAGEDCIGVYLEMTIWMFKTSASCTDLMLFYLNEYHMKILRKRSILMLVWMLYSSYSASSL